MTVSVIDGSIESAISRNLKSKYPLFDSVIFRDRNGASKTVEKVSAASNVAAVLTPGASGRFYLTEALGQKGIHAVRLDDGRALHGFYNNMELILAIGALAGAFMLAVGIAGASGFMITPVILGIFLAIGWFMFRSVRLEGQRQFDADASRAPAG
jgi:hypothetical protein